MYRFGVKVLLCWIGIIGILIGLTCSEKKQEQRKTQVSFQPVTVKVDVKKLDGSYCFNCTLLNLVRTEGRILAVLKISNVTDDILYLKPNPEIGGDGKFFDFTTSYLFSSGKKFGLAKEFPSAPLFGGFEFLTGKYDDIMSNSEIFWMWFEQVPPEIKRVDVIIPHIDPFNDIKILDEHQKTTRVSTDRKGVECEIREIKVTDQSTQVTLSFIETKGRLAMLWPNSQVGLPHAPEVFKPGFSKIVAGGKTYAVLKVESGEEASFLATQFEEKTVLNPGGTVDFWMKFPKLPQNVNKVTLLVPNCEPFVNVPIAGPWVKMKKTEKQQLGDLIAQIAVIKLEMEEMVEEVEEQFAAIQSDLDNKPSNTQIENMKNAVRNTRYEIKMIKDIVGEKSVLVDPKTGNKIVLGKKFIEFWAAGLKNYGIKKSKYSPKKGKFSLRVDEIFEKEFSKDLVEITKGEWKGTFEDQKGNLIIPGVRYYLEQMK